MACAIGIIVTSVEANASAVQIRSRLFRKGLPGLSHLSLHQRRQLFRKIPVTVSVEMTVKIEKEVTADRCLSEFARDLMKRNSGNLASALDVFVFSIAREHFRSDRETEPLPALEARRTHIGAVRN